MPTAVMSDIVRQRIQQLKSAVSASIQQAFELLGNSVKSGRPEYVQAAADLYLNRLVSERTKTGILTLSNKAHQEINLAVRAGLQAEGQIGSVNVVISSPKPLRSSKIEAMSIDSYQPGDVVLVLQNVASAGIKRDEAYQIAQIVGKAI